MEIMGWDRSTVCNAMRGSLRSEMLGGMWFTTWDALLDFLEPLPRLGAELCPEIEMAVEAPEGRFEARSRLKLLEPFLTQRDRKIMWLLTRADSLADVARDVGLSRHRISQVVDRYRRKLRELERLTTPKAYADHVDRCSMTPEKEARAVVQSRGAKVARERRHAEAERSREARARMAWGAATDTGDSLVPYVWFPHDWGESPYDVLVVASSPLAALGFAYPAWCEDTGQRGPLNGFLPWVRERLQRVPAEEWEGIRIHRESGVVTLAEFLASEGAKPGVLGLRGRPLVQAESA